MTAPIRTLADVLRSRVEEHGDRVGLGFRVEGRFETWSWTEYFRQVQQASNGLCELGVAAGDHVLVLVIEPESAAVLVLGCWLLGAVPIQVGVPYRLTDPAAFLDELTTTAARLRAKVLVISDRFGPAPGTDVLRVVTATEVRSARPQAAAIPGPGGHDVALVQLTSGSTGRPRGVVVGHDELLLHMESMSRVLRLTREGMVGVSWLPLHHDMGLIGGLLFPLYNDFPVYLLSPVDFRARPFAWLEAMSELRAGISPAPPSAYALAARLAERAVAAGLDLGAWECAMVGAEPISPKVIRSFADAFAPCGFRAEAFFPVYGLAEATVAVTFPRLLSPTHFDVVSRTALEREGRAAKAHDASDAVEWVGVGSAIPNSEIRVMDDEGRELDERSVGEIRVRSATLFRGYFEEPDATREALEGGWLRTGDLGYVADGQLYVTGRKKDVIIKGGHNLSPATIEETVSEVPGVRAGCVAAVGLHVPELQTEQVWVVAETKLEVPEHRDLSRRIREALKARGIAVDQIRLAEPGSLPKTTSGKVRRAKVREEVRAGRIGSEAACSGSIVVERERSFH